LSGKYIRRSQGLGFDGTQYIVDYLFTHPMANARVPKQRSKIVGRGQHVECEVDVQIGGNFAAFLPASQSQAHRLSAPVEHFRSDRLSKFLIVGHLRHKACERVSQNAGKCSAQRFNRRQQIFAN
jgi:hypothetical protein